MKTWMMISTVALLAGAVSRAETNLSATVAAVTATATAAVTVTKAPGPTNEPTVVTSDRLQVDYAHNVGTFEGSVLAVDPRITVRADKVTAFFASEGTTNASRQVQRLIAEGGVVITQEKRKATGERAEYVAAQGKVVLTGNPQVQTPEGTVTGQKITFWQGQEKMDVEAGGAETNRPRLIFYPEEQRKKEE
jgi:lipopolysaccharide transport protein LptA